MKLHGWGRLPHFVDFYSNDLLVLKSWATIACADINFWIKSLIPLISSCVMTAESQLYKLRRGMRPETSVLMFTYVHILIYFKLQCFEQRVVVRRAFPPACAAHAFWNTQMHELKHFSHHMTYYANLLCLCLCRQWIPTWGQGRGSQDESLKLWDNNMQNRKVTSENQSWVELLTDTWNMSGGVMEQQGWEPLR